MNKVNILYILLLILLFYNFFFIYNNANKKFLSLIIPAEYEDFISCFDINIHNIYVSCDYVDEIIIVLSNIKNRTNIVNKKYIILRNLCNKIKIHIFLNKKSTAENRNYGYSKSKSRYISFFDSDDVMSKYRMKFIRLFLLNNLRTDLLLHLYNTNIKDKDIKSPNMNKINSYVVNVTSYELRLSYQKIYYNTEHNNSWCCRYKKKIIGVHNGWPTVKRKVMNYIKYDKQYDRGQDSDFNSRVILGGYDIKLISLKLGLYKKSRKLCNSKLKLNYLN